MFLVFRSLSASSRLLPRTFPGHLREYSTGKQGRQYRRPRNEEISYNVVLLVNPETGRLDPPCALTDLLATIDRKTHLVELVSVPERLKDGPDAAPSPYEQSSDGSTSSAQNTNDSTNTEEVASSKGPPQYPIVRIVSRIAIHEAEKARKQSRSRSTKQKEIQLTWGVADGDLIRKLRKAREELEKGSRVDVVFAPKAGAQMPSVTDRQKRLDKAVELLSDVATQWKSPTVERNVVILSFQKTT